MEDKKTLLGDDTAKIFLNTESNMEDVNQKLIAFLDYVAGKKSDDSFVQKLDNAIKKAKQNREWRHEYMTLLMRDQENIERVSKKVLKKVLKKVSKKVSKKKKSELLSVYIIMVLHRIKLPTF